MAEAVKDLLFTLHRVRNILQLNILSTATIIMAARAAFGMYWTAGVRQRIAVTTNAPVMTPPSGVFTPDCELIAVLKTEEKEQIY